MRCCSWLDGPFCWKTILAVRRISSGPWERTVESFWCSRDLSVSPHTQSVNAQPLSGFPLILEGGEVGCPGVGSGPAIHVSDDSEMDSFPEGGVLVARRSSPKFIRLMSKTRAIVTDVGSTTGHMASLARELRVPTLLNTKIATHTIPPWDSGYCGCNQWFCL